MTLSVIIPTWNEATTISAAVAHAAAVPGIVEIIVSDGGSTDGTRALAEAAGALVVVGAKGRGAQLRLGAENAIGEVIVFLHADTWLEPAVGESIQRAMRPSPATPPIVGGAFTKRFRDAPWIMRGARFRSWLFFRLTGWTFGDQAIFLRRKVLEEIGGVPPVPLMEEFELCRRLKRVGRLVLLRPSVSASARRFRKNGVLATYWRMTQVLWLYWRGRSPEELSRIYESDKTVKKGL